MSRLKVSLIALSLASAVGGAGCKPDTSKLDDKQPTGGGTVTRSAPRAASSGSSSSKPAVKRVTPAATSKTTPSPRPTKLTIAKLELRVGLKRLFTLSADGKVTRSGKLLGTLSADGHLRREGKVVAQLRGDGSIVVDGKVLPARLDRNSSLVTGGGKTLTFQRDGTLQGGNPRAPKLRVSGLSDATRRTAMFLVAMMFVRAKARRPTGSAR
ncbi:MAG: hypothetical protein KC503_07710 [Myxococcales bacterium]|nr:hypothetical protein [Myxococcales bacterium]